MDRSALAAHLVTKAQLLQRLKYEYLPTGIIGFDSQISGVPRGAITEICGPASSGKTTFLHALIANSCAKGEFCALVDAMDSFDPASAAAAGADLRRLLWVRCARAEEAVRSADLLLQSGGWGLIVLDLSDLSAEMMRKVPLSYWHRLKRAVENTQTAFIVVAVEPCAKNCAVMLLEMQRAKAVWSGAHHDFQLLRGMDLAVTPRKPVQSHVRLHLHSRAC
jgi:recombination protein RecA